MKRDASNGRYILDEKGEPIPCDDFIEWSKWFNANKRTVAHNDVCGSEVSTVFLGYDHRLGEGEPLIFETMIFGGKHDQYQERYSTKDEAIKGHEKACKMMEGDSDG